MIRLTLRPPRLARAFASRPPPIPTRILSSESHGPSPPPRSTRYLAACAAGAAALFYALNLETVPVSGRRRFNFIPDWIVLYIADRTHAALAREHAAHLLPVSDPRTCRVRRVLARLVARSGMPAEPWDAVVVDADTVANAAVLPGGRVIVYSGLLRVAPHEAMLAAVLGHEIAHNLARHQGERISAMVAYNLAVAAGVGAMVVGIGWFATCLVVGVVGVYSGGPGLGVVYNLPMDRRQESEADYIGLMLMAQACYDPRAAEEFWRRMEMAVRTPNVEVPEVLNTHPSNERRLQQLIDWMPEAQRRLEQSGCVVDHEAVRYEAIMDYLRGMRL